MKKIFLVIMLFAAGKAVIAQTDTTKHKNDWSKIDLTNRANDHFMVQYGYDGWIGTNDSITPSGFSRHFNFYAMFDKPFKSNPHLSVGFGLGIGSSNIFFKNTYIDLKSPTATLPFKDVSTTNHFDKYKLSTLFLDVPIEFRYAGNPVTPDKGLKAAIGFKFGTILKAYTKGKNYVNSTGQSVYGTSYIAKESDKRFFNTTRIIATARIGYGIISLDGSYQFSNLLKTGAGPAITPYSIGLTLSGL